MGIKNWEPQKLSQKSQPKHQSVMYPNGTGNFDFFVVLSRNRYGKNLVLKKVPVSVSKIFGTGKSIGIV